MCELYVYSHWFYMYNLLTEGSCGGNFPRVEIGAKDGCKDTWAVVLCDNLTGGKGGIDHLLPHTHLLPHSHLLPHTHLLAWNMITH